MDRQTMLMHLNPKQFELIMLPTEQCNFRCTYCYEDFALGQMSEATLQAAKNLLLLRLPKINSFYLSWFGGEPLMAKQVVYEYSEFAQRVCAEAGVKFDSGMTSNAFALDAATLARLLRAGVRTFQITLDGTEEKHNQTRVMISGRGTFERIWSNLQDAHAQPEKMEINLRLHYHQHNLDDIRELMRKLHQAFGADPRFNINLHPVDNWGGESVKKMDLVKNKFEVRMELEQYLRDIGWFAARPHLLQKTPPPSVCYASRPHALVLRADGSLAKCTVAFNDARNKIGHLQADGSVQIEDAKMRAFMGGFADADEKYLACPMRHMPKQSAPQVIKFERQPALTQAAVA